MSFFDDASLAFLPSGAAGKDGKAYSIKPTDGTGDFTFSRGSNLAATRVGADGLIEKGRENLLLQSNNFDTTWFNVRSTETGGQTDKDGGSTAWLLESTDASTSYIQQDVSNSGVQTFSVIAKKGTTDFMYLLVFGSNFAGQYFDLNNGTLANPVYTTIDASIEDLGGGWYRCSLFFQSNVTHVTIYPADSGTSSLSAVGSNIYIQDAQLEIGLAATDYIESGATTGKAGLLEDEPRFDYSGGATCPSLLLEGSRTNLLTYSEQMNLWDNGTASVTANVTTSPDGFQNADSINNTADVSTFVSASNVAHTFSLFVKQGTSATASIDMSDGVTGDVITTFTFATKTFSGTIAVGSWTSPSTAYQDYGNGWYRISLTATKGAGASIGYKIIASGTGTTFVWGAQLEAGAYPTSYIPNHSGGSVTRGDELATGAGTSSTFNSEEGVLYAEVSLNLLTPNMYIQISDGTYSNRVAIINNNSSSTWRVFYRVNGVSQIDASETGLNCFETNKIAISWKLNEFKFYVNGVKITQVNSGSVNTANTFDRLEFKDILGMNFYGNAKQVLVFPTALSDADLATLTTI